jgi:predicted membrane protein DUF2157
MIATMKRETVSGAVRQLVDDGLVASDRAAQVDARLQELLLPPDAVDAAPDAASRIAKIVAWLGGLLVAAGILFFIGLDWDQLGTWTKLALIFGGLAGLHYAGWRLQVEPGDGSPRGSARGPAVGLALTGAAMVSFGGAIALVAQIYHLDSHWPHAWLAWWLLDLPFVLIFGSRALLLIVVALFVAWGGQCVEVFSGDHAMYSADEVAYGYAILAMAGCVAGAGALARGGRFERLAPTLGLLAKLGALAGLFVLSFHDFVHDRIDLTATARWSDPGRLRQLGLLFTPAAWFTAGAVALLAAGAALSKGWRHGRAWTLEPLDCGAVLGAGLLVAACDLVAPFAAPLVANGLILGSVLALIVRGVRLGRVGDVNLALAFFLVTAIARYFEYFSKGFAPAFTFVGAGVLLLALGAFIERLRRKFVAQARRSRP